MIVSEEYCDSDVFTYEYVSSRYNDYTGCDSVLKLINPIRNLKSAPESTKSYLSKSEACV